MWRRNAQRLLLLSLALLTPGQALAQLERATVGVHWDKVLGTSKTAPTLQVVVNPMLRRGSRIHDPVFKALHDLGADYVRYVPWLPYPKLAVAELDPPTDSKTSWNFSLIDPMTIDFLEATRGHPVVLNFSTIPQWMFQTDKPVPHPADPDQVTWSYELKEVGISDYPIFREGQDLFLVMRVKDFNRAWEELEKDPVNQRWQQAIRRFFMPLPDLQPGERFAMMKEVFYME